MLSRISKSACILFMPGLISAQVSSVRLTLHAPETAGDKNVYVAGSFNGWKAGDSLYRMKKGNEGLYSIVLPVYKDVRYQYKYTCGGWNEVELSANDSNIRNRAFIASRNKQKIRDTVEKWARPKPQAGTSPGMLRINAMKDSVLAGLQPKLNEMLLLLKEYTINLLQENPSVTKDSQITEDVMVHFRDAYGRINDLFHKIFESLTPEQKQGILKAVSSRGEDKDFINTLGAALNEAVK